MQFHRLDLRWRRPLGGGRLLGGEHAWAPTGRARRCSTARSGCARSASRRASLYERTLGLVVDLIVGGDANAQDFQASVPDFGRRPSDLSRSRGAFTQGAFATLAIHAGQRLTISPGVRGDLLRRAGRPPHGDPAAAGRRCSRRRTRWRSRRTAGASRRCPACPSASRASRRSGSRTWACRPPSAARWASRRGCRCDVTANVTGYFQRAAAHRRARHRSDVAGSRARPTSWCHAAAAPTAPSCSCAAPTAAGCSAGSRTRCRGACAKTTTASSDRSDWDQRHILNLVGGYRLRGGYSVGRALPPQHRPPRPRDRQRRPVPAAAGVLSAGPARRTPVRVRSLRDEPCTPTSPTPRSRARSSRSSTPTTMAPTCAAIQEQSFRLILPTIGVHAEF